MMSVTDFSETHTAPVPTLQSIQPFLPSISDPAGLSRHASASAAVGPEKVMPLWPLWSTRNETERRATQSYEHVGIVGFFYERVYME